MKNLFIYYTIIENTCQQKVFRLKCIYLVLQKQHRITMAQYIGNI